MVMCVVCNITQPANHSNPQIYTLNGGGGGIHTIEVAIYYNSSFRGLNLNF